MTANLSNLAKLLQNTGFYSSFQTFCVKLYEQIASQVGWDPKEGEGNITTKNFIALHPLGSRVCVNDRNKPPNGRLIIRFLRIYSRRTFLEGHLHALLRGLVLGCMGHSGDPATIAEARKRFDAHCKGETIISADLRSAVYRTVLKHGDDVTLNAMMKLFREADLDEEKVRLMSCMGAVSQPELIKKVLAFSMSVGSAALIIFTRIVMVISSRSV